MEIYTTGFTKKSAEQFFNELRSVGVERLLDVRISNTSQLSGFAKKDDLAFFLQELCDVSYRHEPLLAPTQELLKAYRNRTLDWEQYQVAFLELLRERQVQLRLSPEAFKVPTVLLCSENRADECHRRLVVEYLSEHWGDIVAVHL